MPATTRSQTTLEDKGVTSSKTPPPKAQGTKRKATASRDEPPKKQRKQPAKSSNEEKKPAKQEETEDGVDGDTILINRAPVLELWASSVAHFLHPKLSWSTCLSIGGAISTITALSKGRAIGTIDKPSKDEQAEKKAKREKEQDGLDELKIMSFHLKVNDAGNAMVGGKEKKGNEGALEGKFGAEAYEKVKKVMEESLKQWQGQEDELNERAFHMYEDFRPNVAKGQKGWGRKGQLSFETMKTAISKD